MIQIGYNLPKLLT